VSNPDAVARVPPPEADRRRAPLESVPDKKRGF
jgi:hypothetical protein